MNRHAILLHAFVMVVAFTAILGRLIELPAATLVFWRTLLAAVILLAWLALSKRAPLNIGRQNIAKALGVGILLGCHWITFFYSIKLANISVCLAGMASVSFFTSLTEPLFERKRPRLSEVLLGLLVIPGLVLVAGASWHHAAGFICALISAFFASLFPVINKKLTLGGLEPESLTFYEMIGACLTCLLLSLLFEPSSIQQLPSAQDWLWLFLLSGICTVWAFSIHIHLLRVYSAFTTTLAINFEPVYGIILAAIIFGEHSELSKLFYLGASLIIVANVVHAFLSRRATKTTLAPGEIPVSQ